MQTQNLIQTREPAHAHTDTQLITQTHTQSARPLIHEKCLRITKSGTVFFSFSYVLPLHFSCSLPLK